MKAALLFTIIASASRVCHGFVVPHSPAFVHKLRTTTVLTTKPNEQDDSDDSIILSSDPPPPVSASSSVLSPALSTSLSARKLDYDWKNQWYALTYADYIPNPSKSAEVTPAAVFGNPLVLWKTSDNGIIHCADDVCPHRSAALSEGRVKDGKLECYYHVCILR